MFTTDQKAWLQGFAPARAWPAHEYFCKCALCHRPRSKYNMRAVGRQIGNAVPSSLGRFVGAIVLPLLPAPRGARACFLPHHCALPPSRSPSSPPPALFAARVPTRRMPPAQRPPPPPRWGLARALPATPLPAGRPLLPAPGLTPPHRPRPGLWTPSSLGRRDGPRSLDSEENPGDAASPAPADRPHPLVGRLIAQRWYRKYWYIGLILDVHDAARKVTATATATAATSPTRATSPPGRSPRCSPRTANGSRCRSPAFSGTGYPP